METRIVTAAAFIVDLSTNRIVGLKHPDGTEELFATEDTQETLTNKTLVGALLEDPSFKLSVPDSPITPTGSTRDDALALDPDRFYHNFTGPLSGGEGVVLPPVATGGFIVVRNNAGAAVKIYGSGSDTVDGVAAATGTTIADRVRALLFRVDNGWISGPASDNLSRVVSTQNTATLTNKTLTSPVINTPVTTGGTLTGSDVDDCLFNRPTMNTLFLDPDDALTAAGTDKATALQLSSDPVQRLTTVASGTGVVLPDSELTGFVVVINSGANTLQVYGFDTDTIDGAAAATGVAVTAGTRAFFLKVAAETWVSLSLPSVGNLATLTGTETLTNKTLEAPTVNTATINNPNIVGTATNDSAASGSVGEYMESEIVSGSAVSLTTATGANITTLSVPAGDWDIGGVVAFSGNALTQVDVETGSISLVSATSDNSTKAQATFAAGTLAHRLSATFYTLATKRYSFASTTTVYLVASGVFTINSLSAFGRIWARRVR
jgi:hypothetical protein